MLDVLKSQVFLTVFCGVLVYVIGQIIVKFIIEPFKDRSTVLGEVAVTIVSTANVIANPSTFESEDVLRIRRDLVQLAGQLLATSNAIPWYSIWQKFWWVPTREDIFCATILLGVLAHSPFNDSSYEAKQISQIPKLLKIKFATDLSPDRLREIFRG